MTNIYKISLILLSLLLFIGCSSNNSPPKFNYGDVVTIEETPGLIVEIRTTWNGPYYEVMFASGKRDMYEATEIKFFTNFPWDVTDKNKTADLLKNFEKLGVPDMSIPNMGPAT